MEKEKLRKSELTREKQRLLWEENFMKILKKILGTVLAVIVYMFPCMAALAGGVNQADGYEQVSVTLDSDFENSDYINVMLQYYQNINDGNIDRAVNLYSEALYEYIVPFLKDSSARDNHEGLYNIISVEDIDYVIVGEDETLQFEGNTYNNVTTFFVKCDMSVYNSDKYYREGINYFLVSVGEDYDSDISIINIEIPLYDMICNYEEDLDIVEDYQVFRNNCIYGDTACVYSDAPVYVDRVANPSTIRVYVNGTVDTVNFKTYLQRNGAVEFNSGLTYSDGYKASAMAAKMFAIHKVLTAASGANYDITSTQQGYSTTKTLSSNASDAIDYIYNYFLIDYYGAVFPTFYRTQASNSSYCKQYGGIMPQKEADSLAGKSGWQYALKYYYTRTSSVSYYNSQMNTGNLIITTAHNHDWSGGSTCSYCSAIAK